MKCDTRDCKADLSYFALRDNGRSVVVNGLKRNMTVCPECLERDGYEHGRRVARTWSFPT